MVAINSPQSFTIRDVGDGTGVVVVVWMGEGWWCCVWSGWEKGVVVERWRERGVERGRMARMGVESEFIPSKLWAAPG